MINTGFLIPVSSTIPRQQYANLSHLQTAVFIFERLQPAVLHTLIVSHGLVQNSIKKSNRVDEKSEVEDKYLKAYGLSPIIMSTFSGMTICLT